MASGYTSADLLSVIKNQGMLPDGGLSQGTDDTALLEHANAALRTKIYPEVLKYREEYFVVTTRTTLVSGTSRYRLPSRAGANRLRDLFFVDSGGNHFDVEPLGREDLELYNGAAAGDPQRFYLEGNYVVLLPTPTGGSLEMAFYFAPSDLVVLTAARQVASVILSTKHINLATAAPTSWTVLNTFDVHSGQSGAEIRVWDAAVSTVSGTAVDFINPIDGSTFGTNAIEVGDWFCLAGECAIPGLPRELHPMLARATALRVAEAMGATEKAQLHAAFLKDDMQSLTPMMNDRVEGRPITITGVGGMLWDGRRRWW